MCNIPCNIFWSFFAPHPAPPTPPPRCILEVPSNFSALPFLFFFFWKQSTKSNLYCLSTTGCATIHWITRLKKTHSFSLRNHRVPILFFLTTVAVSFGVKCFYHIQKMLLSLRSFPTSGDWSFYSFFHVGYFYVLHCVRVKECVEVERFFTDYTCCKDLQVASFLPTCSLWEGKGIGSQHVTSKIHTVCGWALVAWDTEAGH